MTTLSSRGTAPPSTNTLSQPWWGTSHADRNPPPAAPTVNPENTMVTSSELREAGETSRAKVATIGMIPPMAKPAMKRQTMNCLRLSAQATSSVNNPNSITLLHSTRRRPKRSPSGPAVRAPSVRPTSAALSTGARSSLVQP